MIDAAERAELASPRYAERQAQAEAELEASDETKSEPTTAGGAHGFTNEVIAHTLRNYLAEVVKGDAEKHQVSYSSEGLVIQEFEFVQSTLVALMGGTCPFANLRVGRCVIELPTVKGRVPHLSIASLEYDALPFPNLMPRAACEEVMGRLNAHAKKARRDAKHKPENFKLEQMSQTIRDDPRFKLLNFFDGLTWLLIVLSVVVALFIISMLQITGDLPDATESTGMYIFDMIFTVAFAVELSMRIECYRFVHGRVCPDFFRDPMVVIDTLVVTLDIGFQLLNMNPNFVRIARGAKLLRLSKFNRVARGVRVLRLGKVMRKFKLQSELKDLRKKNEAHHSYGFIAKMLDQVTVSVGEIKMHQLKPTHKALKEWREGARSKRLVAEERAVLSHTVVSDKHGTEDREYQLCEFASRRVMHITGIRLENVSETETPGAQETKGQPPAFKILKRLAVEKFDMYDTDQMHIHTPFLEPCAFEADIVMTRRHPDGVMLDIEVDMEPPETFSAVLAGVPALPITVSFKRQAASPEEAQEERAEQPVVEKRPSRQGGFAPDLKPIASLTVSETESNAWFEASDRKARSNIVWSTLYTSLGENPARWEALFELYDNRRNHSLTYEDFRELLQACGIEMDDLQFEEICRDVDTDGDRLIEVQEFFAYVKAQPVNLPTSASHANEPEVAPPNKSVPPSSLLDMIFCIFPKFSEGPRSEELELCSNSTAQQGEGDVELGAQSAQPESEAQGRQSSFAAMENYVHDYFKPYADPFLVRLIEGYDASASSEMVTYSNEGFEVAPFKLKQETLVALAGGTLKYGRFRIGRCSVKIPSVSGVVSTVLFGSARDGTDPVRIHIESVEFDKLPFPDVAQPDKMEAILEALHHAVHRSHDDHTTPIGPRTVKPYSSRVQLMDGIELTIGRIEISMLDPTPEMKEKRAQLLRRMSSTKLRKGSLLLGQAVQKPTSRPSIDLVTELEQTSGHHVQIKNLSISNRRGHDGVTFEQVGATAVVHKRLKIGSLEVHDVDHRRQWTPRIHPFSVEAELSLSRHLDDGAPCKVSVDIMLAETFTVLLPHLPVSTRVRLRLRHVVANSGSHAKWLEDSSHSVDACAVRRLIQLWCMREHAGSSDCAATTKDVGERTRRRLNGLLADLSAFGAGDPSCSPDLSYDQVCHLLTKNDIKMSAAALRTLFKRLDSANCGRVKCAEFMRNFLQVPQGLSQEASATSVVGVDGHCAT